MQGLPGATAPPTCSADQSLTTGASTHLPAPACQHPPASTHLPAQGPAPLLLQLLSQLLHARLALPAQLRLSLRPVLLAAQPAALRLKLLRQLADPRLRLSLRRSLPLREARRLLQRALHVALETLPLRLQLPRQLLHSGLSLRALRRLLLCTLHLDAQRPALGLQLSLQLAKTGLGIRPQRRLLPRPQRRLLLGTALQLRKPAALRLQLLHSLRVAGVGAGTLRGLLLRCALHQLGGLARGVRRSRRRQRQRPKVAPWMGSMISHRALHNDTRPRKRATLIFLHTNAAHTRPARSAAAQRVQRAARDDQSRRSAGTAHLKLGDLAALRLHAQRNVLVPAAYPGVPPAFRQGGQE